MRKELADSLKVHADTNPRSVEATKPELTAEALTLLSQGFSRNKIFRKTGLAESTIDRLRYDHRKFLCESGAEQGRKAARIAAAATRVLEAKIHQLDPAEASSEEDKEQRLSTISEMSAREVSLLYSAAVEKNVSLNANVGPSSDAPKSENTLDMVQGLLKELKAEKGKNAKKRGKAS